MALRIDVPCPTVRQDVDSLKQWSESVMRPSKSSSKASAAAL